MMNRPCICIDITCTTKTYFNLDEHPLHSAGIGMPRENYNIDTAAAALAPCITRSSAAIADNMICLLVRMRVFNGKG